MTATIAPARPAPTWVTESLRLRFDLATTRAMLAAIVARADRRRMLHLRSVSLADLLQEARQGR
jgi:hypothetical protein